MVRARPVDHADRHRVIEAARAGARRIEVADAVDHLVVRQMTVAEDHEVGPLPRDRPLHRFAQVVRTGEDVRDENRFPPGDLQPFAVVHISADERDRGDFTQRVEDVIPADVAGVDDRLGAAERLESFRPDQAVRVGDDADQPQMDAFFAQTLFWYFSLNA